MPDDNLVQRMYLRRAIKDMELAIECLDHALMITVPTLEISRQERQIRETRGDLVSVKRGLSVWYREEFEHDPD